jgi:hypothetical protein
MGTVGGQQRRQGGQLVDVGDACALVARLRAGHAQRHNLAQEAALSCRPLGLDVRVQRIVVLPEPRDAEAPRQLLGGHHRVRRLGAVAVRRLEAHEPRRLKQVSWARHPPRRRGQGFRAAGDYDVGLAQRHGAHAEQDGIETGGALPVDGQGRNVVAKAGREADDARGVVASGRIAEDNLVDRASLQVRIPKRRLQHRCREAVDAPALVQPARAADGRATRCDDIRGSQSRGLGHGKRT